MLQGFVDDSATHTGDRRLWLAGYIMGAEKWKAFSDDWAEVLRAPPRALSSLHMAGSFHGWSHKDRYRKLVQLASVIEKYEPLSIECSVSQTDFDKIVKPSVVYDLRHPYFACFHGLVFQAANMIGELGLQGPLDFVFDEQGRVGTDAVIYYKLMKQLYPDRIKSLLGGPPIFRDDTQVLPLQAADMLAWHRRAIMQPNCTQEQRVIADRLVFHHGVANIPAEILHSWANSLSKIPGISAARGRKGSMKKLVSELTAKLPEERLVPVMEEISKRARRARRMKALLESLGLRKLSKWLVKREFTVK